MSISFAQQIDALSPQDERLRDVFADNNAAGYGAAIHARGHVASASESDNQEHRDFAAGETSLRDRLNNLIRDGQAHVAAAILLKELVFDELKNRRAGAHEIANFKYEMNDIIEDLFNGVDVSLAVHLRERGLVDPFKHAPALEEEERKRHAQLTAVLGLPFAA